MQIKWNDINDAIPDSGTSGFSEERINYMLKYKQLELLDEISESLKSIAKSLEPQEILVKGLAE